MLRATFHALLFIFLAAGCPMVQADDVVDHGDAPPANVPTLAGPQAADDTQVPAHVGDPEAMDGHDEAALAEHPNGSQDDPDSTQAGDGRAEDGHAGADHTAGGHAANDHGEHDPTDLSHANASRQLHDPSELRFDMAICTFLVFVVLLILLRVVAWKPIMLGLDQRERSIASRIEQAERAAEEADEQLRQYRAKLAGAGEESKTIIAQARKDSEAIADRIREEAKSEASRQRDRAIADIQAAKSNAVRDVARQTADMAVVLAGRIVHRELKPEDHASLISEALERFPSNN